MDDKCSKTFHVIIIDKIDILTSREEEEEEFANDDLILSYIYIEYIIYPAKIY